MYNKIMVELNESTMKKLNSFIEKKSELLGLKITKRSVVEKALNDYLDNQK